VGFDVTADDDQVSTLVTAGPPPGRDPRHDAVATEVATRMAEAAAAWLDTLDADQRAVARVGSPGTAAEAERLRWFYTPTDHGGLTLHQQRPAQQDRAMALVASGLSTPAYVSVATVMGLENVLSRSEGFGPGLGRERKRDPGLYYLRVFGEPRGDAPWGWRFGGHHVSLNNLVVDGALRACTPLFLGADPASSPLLGGATLRPFGRVEDLARELVRSLDATSAARAVLLATAPSDIVAGNRARLGDGDQLLRLSQVWRTEFPDAAQWARLVATSDAAEVASGYGPAEHHALALTAAPKGLPASALDTGGRELLRALLDTYLGRAPDGLAPVYDEVALDAVHFAWAGSTEPGEGHYYRLQGPRLLVEYDNTQRGVNHVHSVWRDPEGDFGVDALAAHRARHH
jgi:hypothetical protein